VCCFYKYYDEPDNVVRVIGPSNSRFVATDNYPGPPLVNGKLIGSTRCPSYARAVKGLYNHDRSPPPAYKIERKDGFLETMKNVITDSFASWFSVNQDITHITEDTNSETDSTVDIPSYRVV